MSPDDQIEHQGPDKCGVFKRCNEGGFSLGKGTGHGEVTTASQHSCQQNDRDLLQIQWHPEPGQADEGEYANTQVVAYDQ